MGGWLTSDFFSIIAAAFVVGSVVGLTGMGGGALMTPALIFLGVGDASTVVTADLTASAIYKTGGAITLFLATHIGVPVSTTHTITGAIVGVGAARRVSAVRWNLATGIVWAWVITVPIAGLTGALFYGLARLADRLAG